jgi:hypothetical protein
MTDKTPQYLAMQCDDLPTSCVNYAVADTLTGKEVCRVWDEGDCRTIADLLNEPPRPEPAAPDLARKAANADRLADALGELAAMDFAQGRSARIEAGDAMKVAVVDYLTDQEYPIQLLRSIEALDTAAIVGDGALVKALESE